MKINQYEIEFGDKAKVYWDRKWILKMAHAIGNRRRWEKIEKADARLFADGMRYLAAELDKE